MSRKPIPDKHQAVQAGLAEAQEEALDRRFLDLEADMDNADEMHPSVYEADPFLRARVEEMYQREESYLMLCQLDEGLLAALGLRPVP